MRKDTSLRKNPCKDKENKPKHHHEHLIIYLLLWIEVVFAHKQLGKDCTETKKEVLFYRWKGTIFCWNRCKCFWKCIISIFLFVEIWQIRRKNLSLHPYKSITVQYENLWSNPTCLLLGCCIVCNESHHGCRTICEFQQWRHSAE